MKSMWQLCRSLRLDRLVMAFIMTLVGLMALTTGRGMAQVTTASLSGTVTDSSDAVVPKAKIVLTSQSTGAARNSVTNSEGVFSFAAVPTGDYTVKVTAGGFESLIQTGIHLDPQDQRVLRGLKLAVGSETTNVTVQSGDSVISSDSGEISSLISAEDIKHLAIEGRDVSELLKILPGFTPVTTSVANQVYDPSQVGVSGAVGQYSGNGTPLYAVAVLSDGADITDPGNFGATIQTINYDQVAEVKVQTASMTADTAHGPIVLNAVGASGGSKFHGSLYTYARTNQLNSVDWYTKYTGQLKPADREIYPGFTFGGPIAVPHTPLTASRKLNFWVGAEQYAQRNVYAYNSAAAATISALVPTAAMRSGDFSQEQVSQYLGSLYGAPKIVNGFEQQQCYANYNNICQVPKTGTDGSPITNGNIAAFLDPGAKALLNLYPLPTPGVVPSVQSPFNYIHTNLVGNNLWQARGRVDYAPGEKNKLFLVYSTEKGPTSVPSIPYYQPQSVMGETNTPGGGMINNTHTQLGALNLSTIFTPTLTNEFYGSVSYFNLSWKNKSDATTKAATDYPYVGLYDNNSLIVPQMSDYGYDGLPIALYQDYGDTGFLIKKFIRTFGDNVTKQWGTHTIRTGVFAQMDTNNQVKASYQPTNGSISQYYLPEFFTTVNGQQIHSTGEVGSGRAGNLLADFAEGSIYEFDQSNIGPGANLYFWNISGYAQDHWRILQNLSIDYGLRIEHITPWSDAHEIGIPVWDPKAYYSDKAGSPLPGFLWHSIDHSIPNSGFATRWGYVEPRVGFSWDPYKSGKTIFRGGFGIFRAHDAYNDASDGYNNALGVRTLIQQITTLATVNTAKAPDTAGTISQSTFYGVTRGDDEMPQVKTWDAAIVQNLPSKMQIQIAYVGSASNHMLDDGAEGQIATLDNINALPVGAIYNTGQYTVENYNQVASLGVDSINKFRPYPIYHNLDIARHRLTSNYNGLQTSLLRQSGHVLFSMNYTFSKALGILGQRSNGQPVDPFNLHNNYGPEGFDRSHVFNVAYTLQEGKPFHARFLGPIVNEWELSGITTLLSGPSMQSINPNFGLSGTVQGAPDPRPGSATNNYQLPINSAVFLGTPDVTLQPRLLCDPNTGRGKGTFFNAACFGLPTALGTNGTYRFPYIHGPAYVENDLTFTKNISFGDGQGLHLRFAAFNFLNHPVTSFNGNRSQEYTLSYNYSDNTLTDLSSAGVLSSIPNANAQFFGHADLKTGRRVVELSLKYTF